LFKYSHVLGFLLLFVGCASGEREQRPKIKNVIFMIGDGMGPQQISLLYHYARYAPHSIYKGGETSFEKLAVNGIGLHIPNPYGEIVIDSAASATQMATGKLSRPGIIGLDRDGQVAETILERAQRAGLGTGLVSDTRLTHATPAAYAAHVISRGMEGEIARQMVQTAPDIMLSGGLKYFMPQNAGDKNSAFFKNYRSRIPRDIDFLSQRTDSLNILAKAEKKGFSLVFDKKSLLQSPAKKILGLFAADAMPDGIWYSKNEKKPLRKVPTLLEMSGKALQVLAQNEKGFFLMIEGGQIDWAGHSNDPGTMLHNMIHFDQTIASVLKWASKRDDTLVIVTADHETGSFAFSYSSRRKTKTLHLNNLTYATDSSFGDYQLLDKLYAQKGSYNTIFDDFYLLPKKQQNPFHFREVFNQSSAFKISLKEAELAIERKDGWPIIHDFRHYHTSSYNAKGGVLARILARKQNIIWGTGSHTATPIPVFTFGPKWITDQFMGLYNNTRLRDLVAHALELD